MTDQERREMEKYRHDHFAVEVTLVNERYSPEPGEVYVNVTHNGHQWQGLTLTPLERLKVIKALLMGG